MLLPGGDPALTSFYPVSYLLQFQTNPLKSCFYMNYISLLYGGLHMLLNWESLCDKSISCWQKFIYLVLREKLINFWGVFFIFSICPSRSTLYSSLPCSMTEETAFYGLYQWAPLSSDFLLVSVRSGHVLSQIPPKVESKNRVYGQVLYFDFKFFKNFL